MWQSFLCCYIIITTRRFVMNKYKKIMAIVLSLAMVIVTFAYLGANEHTNTLAGEESTDQTVAPSEESTEAPSEDPTEAPTEEPTTEPEVNPNNYKYSYVSYYEEFPDSNDNGANLVTQEGATVEGVTAAASADDASYVIDADPNTIWNASGDDTQWITVDLGEVKTVKEIDCRWAEDNTAKAYTVMVSTYGNEFQTVATVDNDSFYDNRRDMIVLGESISTRYIKIEMTESHLPEGYSLREMAVYDDSNYVGIVDYLNKVNTTENLAYKKTPIVARYNNEGQARRYCDGNLNTGWRANKPTDNSWFAIDLKDYYNIDDVMVCWSDANAVAYDIYAGRIPDWYGDEPVASVRGLWDNKAVSAVTKDLNVKARYIKIEVEEWSENSERDGIQPLEIAVFGEKAEGYYNIRDYKWVWPWQYPTMEGKIFAGWFTDETLTESYMDEDGYAYPKFIDEKALMVKMQKKEDNTAIRFVSTISRRLQDFESAGFDFSGTYGESTIDSKSKSIETVYRRITADGVTIRPNTAFDNNDSAYFVTYTIRNMDGVTPSNWTVTPFYVTADGTKVTGKTATFDVVPE